ncbi:MAG: argininosuccinate lyase [Actinomycetota bacterium]
MSEDGAHTLWHGRFEGGPAEALLTFTESRSFDVRLAGCDIRGSVAHVGGLARIGLLTAEERDTIVAALGRVGEELAAGSFVFEPTDEDIHTAIERRVTELEPEAGGKLHTGRSRNDQVATAFRLWVRDAIVAVAERVVEFQQILLDRANEVGDAYLPGYTHLQRAQPVPLAHHLAAHAWALSRDVDRLMDAHRRTDVSPLGAGALAGSSLPLDPAATAADLGFEAVFENSLDVTSDRDFVADTLYALSLLGVHLSRMGEEVVLWSSSEFGFLTLDDAFATGSSMMPQKKNPDIAELTRGKSGRLIGHLTGLLVTMKGLPLAYNRDLQEDKEPVFDAVDQIQLALVAFGGMLATAGFNLDTMADAADDQAALATDLAEILVETGTPFREAHGIVGALVRQSLEGSETLAEAAAASPAFASIDLGSGQLGVASLFEPGASLGRRQSPGGAGTAPVAVQLERLAARIAADRARLAEVDGRS